MMGSLIDLSTVMIVIPAPVQYGLNSVAVIVIIY